jgi:MFS family permease
MEGENPEMMAEDPKMMGEEDMMLPKDDGSTSFGSDKTKFYHRKDQFDGEDIELPSYSCCFVFSLYVLAISAGLLQGYQIGIIAGLELFISDEYKDIHQKVESHERELFVSLFSLGAAFGGLFAGEISDKIGRKYVIILSDCFVAIGFLIIVFGKKVWVGFIGRIISGFGSGFLTFVIPVYLGEVGPAKWQKLSQSMFGFSIGVGMIGGLDLAIPFRHHWKLLYKYGLIPVVGQILITCFMPESHMYYINTGEDDKALEIL